VHGDLLATARDDAKLIITKDAKLESERGKALKTMLYLFERDQAIQYLRIGVRHYDIGWRAIQLRILRVTLLDLLEIRKGKELLLLFLNGCFMILEIA